jgi:hypothetical protein
MQKEKMTPRELRRYLEISFHIAVGLRPMPMYTDFRDHLNNLMINDSLISGYVISITLLDPKN